MSVKWLQNFQSALRSCGRSLYRDNSVLDLYFDETLNGSLLVYADVIGSQGDYYESEIMFHDSDLISADCSCPYGSYCKHCAALTYEYIEYLRKNGLPDEFIKHQPNPLETLTELLSEKPNR